jgi:hypothetical protein
LEFGAGATGTRNVLEVREMWAVLWLGWGGARGGGGSGISDLRFERGGLENLQGVRIPRLSAQGGVGRKGGNAMSRTVPLICPHLYNSRKRSKETTNEEGAKDLEVKHDGYTFGAWLSMGVLTTGLTLAPSYFPLT